MFDIDTLTMSMNYQPVFTGNQTNSNAGPKSSENEVADGAGKKGTEVPRKENREEKEHKGMSLKNTGIFSGAYDDELEGAVADFNNLELTTVVSLIPTTRIYKDHPKEQIIGDTFLAPQTRIMTKTSQEHAMELDGDHIRLFLPCKPCQGNVDLQNQE
nr:hypothetical protein [Tanacetum cinerariifolium]